VPEEVAAARDSIGRLTARYYEAGISEGERMFLRNEIISRRMYIIDVEYSEYETALTTERQRFGFVTSTVTSSLGIASTLVSPLSTAQILSGIGTGIGATRGFYDSEIVIAKTIQIAQGHMRAQRDTVAKNIFSRRNNSTIAYPLSAALSDLEDYYRAGTMTSGLIEAVGQAGGAAQEAAIEKNRVVIGYGVSTDDDAAVLKAFWAPGGVHSAENRDKLIGLLTELKINRTLYEVVWFPQFTAERRRLVNRARQKGVIK
jgi:hypothetical protein